MSEPKPTNGSFKFGGETFTFRTLDDGRVEIVTPKGETIIYDSINEFIFEALIYHIQCRIQSRAS